MISPPVDGPVISKLKKMRLSNDDFKVIKTLGRGAFGEVSFFFSFLFFSFLLLLLFFLLFFSSRLTFSL